MKRLFCFIFVIVIIASFTYPLFVHSASSTASEQFVRDVYAIKNKKDLHEITIVYKKGYKIIYNVVDLFYDERNKTVHYIRHLRDGRRVRGTVYYNDVFFNTPDGYLYYDKNWYYKDNRTNGTYLIKESKHGDIVRFSTDPMNW